jgi:hypothetical protein
MNFKSRSQKSQNTVPSYSGFLQNNTFYKIEIESILVHRFFFTIVKPIYTHYRHLHLLCVSIQLSAMTTHGRRPPAFRSSGPDAATIGGGVQVSQQHAVLVHETEDNDTKVKTKREHRNRLMRMIGWIEDKYPEYVDEGGIINITVEQHADPCFFQHKCIKDFVYSGINTPIIKAFLASQKIKGNGKMASFSHIRKFKDAILFGAEQAGEILPRLFHQETDKFLKAFKKEQVGARREGNTDENDSDPIEFPLYHYIAEVSFLGQFKLIRQSSQLFLILMLELYVLCV